MEIDVRGVQVDSVLNSPVKLPSALAQGAEDWTLVDDDDDACSRGEGKFQVVCRPSDIKMVVSSPHDDDNEDDDGDDGDVKGSIHGKVWDGVGVSSHTVSSKPEGAKAASAGLALQNEGASNSVVLVGVRVSVDELVGGEAIGR